MNTYINIKYSRIAILLVITIFIAYPVKSYAQNQKELELPEIPKSLTKTSDRAGFLLLHFWDNMDWGNKSLVNDNMFMEQNFANYFDLFQHTTQENVDLAIKSLIKQVETDSITFDTILSIADIYLYDAESPVRNDESYLIFVRQVVNSPALTDYRRAVYESTIEDLLKNRVNTQATDFKFITRDGGTKNLYDCINKTGKSILLFYDPDCDNCNMTENLMSSNVKLKNAIAAGVLSVIAVCPYDTDRELWEKHASKLPSEWIVGYSPDGEIDSEGVYIFHSSPTIYILNDKGIVMAKDIKYDSIRNIF